MATAPHTGDPAPTPPRPESLVDLFHALESPLLQYAHRLLPNPTMAEDIVQEAFVRLQASWETVRERRAWLYRTVHNLALNEQRKSGRLQPLPTPGDSRPDPEVATPSNDPTDPQPLPDEQIARWEGIGLVRLLMQTLTPRDRELLGLKFSEGLTYQQISQRTGLSTGHVGYLLHHTLKNLAAELAKSGLVP